MTISVAPTDGHASVTPHSHAGYSRIALITAAALMLLRLAYLGTTELFPEEAYYWNYAKHLDFGYLDHPPLVGWLIHLGTSVFGDGEFGVRIFAIISSLVTTGFVYLLTQFFYGRQAGVVAVLLVQLMPFFFMTGLMMTPDAPLTACWAGALYFIARAIFDRRGSKWWGVGFCMGLGMLSKYSIALLGPATLLFLAVDPPSRRWLRRVEPYRAILLAALIFSPVVVWNAAHHWASFLFQTANRIDEPVRFSLHQLAGAVVVLLTPVGAIAAWKSLWGIVEPFGANSPREWSACEHARILLFARLFTLVPLSIFVVFSLRHLVKLNWTGPLCIAVVPLMAAHLSAVDGGFGPLLRRGWMVTVVVLGFGYVALLQYLAFGIPAIGYAQKTELLPVGWAELGRALSLQKEEVRRASPNGKMLIVGLDRNFIASEAAFYQPNQSEAVRETTGIHLFGATSLMYEAWFPARELEGATLLLVSFKAEDLATASIAQHCERLTPIQEFWMQRKGVRIRPCYTRIAYNYHSVALENANYMTILPGKPKRGRS